MVLDQSFWLAISFFIFFWFAYKPVSAHILELLDARSKKIQIEIEEMTFLKDQASATLKEYQDRHAEIEKEASDIINKAEIEVKKLVDSSAANLSILLEKKKNSVIEQIASKEKDVLQKMHFEVIDLTMYIINKVLNDKVDKNQSEKFVIDSSKDIFKIL